MRKLPDHIQLLERTFQKEVIPPQAIQNVFCGKKEKESIRHSVLTVFRMK